MGTNLRRYPLPPDRAAEWRVNRRPALGCGERSRRPVHRREVPGGRRGRAGILQDGATVRFPRCMKRARWNPDKPLFGDDNAAASVALAIGLVVVVALLLVAYLLL